MEDFYRKNSMKLHKSIRQYARFDPSKLDELIEIDSYDLIESYVNCSCDDIKKRSKIEIGDVLNMIVHKFDEVAIYKHKTNNSYMLCTISITNFIAQFSYFYFKNKAFYFDVHRENKPAQINLSISNKGKYIYLNYYKNGLHHNEHGPAHISYSSKLNDKFLELNSLSFKRNDKFYNKNGLINCLLSSNRIVLKFMKNNILKAIDQSNNYKEITIENLNNSTLLSIVNDGSYYNYHYYSDANLHRLNGPAIIRKKDAIEQYWYINNKKLPDDIIHYEKGLEKDITKTDILKAMLFDQEYGEFLKDKAHETA